jgi:small subunit ribosomal protein S20
VARHKSAEKRARQSENRAARNTSIQHKVTGRVRAFREALASGDRTKAAEALTVASRELQKAASKGVLHTRNASRRVSRMMLAYNSAAK